MVTYTITRHFEQTGTHHLIDTFIDDLPATITMPNTVARLNNKPVTELYDPDQHVLVAQWSHAFTQTHTLHLVYQALVDTKSPIGQPISNEVQWWVTLNSSIRVGPYIAAADIMVNTPPYRQHLPVLFLK